MESALHDDGYNIRLGCKPSKFFHDIVT